jgi:hypothetical protein
MFDKPLIIIQKPIGLKPGGTVKARITYLEYLLMSKEKEKKKAEKSLKEKRSLKRDKQKAMAKS